MKNKLQIAIASACGAVIGYGLGVTFLSGFWTVFAALIGGVTAWVLYDPASLVKDFWISVRGVAKKSKTEMSELMSEPWKQIIRNLASPVLYGCIAGQIIGTLLYCIIVLTSGEGNFARPEVKLITYFLFPMLGSAVFGVAIFLIGICDSNVRWQNRNEDADRPVAEKLALKVIFWSSPIGIPISLLIAFGFIMGLVFLSVPWLITSAWLVVLNTFKLAHNHSRLCCFVGASIGVLYGLIAGHMLVSMVTGAVVALVINSIGSLVPNSYVLKLQENSRLQRIV